MAKEPENIKTEKALKSEVLSLEKQLLDIRSKMRELEDAGLKSSKEYVSLQEKELENERKTYDVKKQIEKIDDRRNEQQQELNDLTNDLIQSMSKQKALMDGQSKVTKDIIGNNDYSSKLNDDILIKIESSVDLLKKQGSLSSAYTRSLQDAKTYSESISDIQKNIVSQADKATAGEYIAVNLSQEKLNFTTLKNKFDKESNSMSREERINTLQLLRSYKQALNQAESMNLALEETAKTSKKVLGVFDSVTNLDIKGAIIKGFGLDEIQSEVKKKLGGSFVNVVNAVRGEKGLVGGLKAAGSALKNMASMAPKLALGLGIGAIVGGFGMLIKAAMHADEEIANMGKELGVSRHEASELHGATKRIAGEMNVVGLNAKEVYEGVKIVGDVMGGIDVASQLAAGNKELEGFVKQASLLSKQFGLSAAEIGNIKDISTITGKSMDALVKESVELGSGTMTAKQTMQVLSTIPPKVAVAFKGGTKELIAAAQKAKLLGMELGRVQDIGMGMLDIESSLQKEMEARVLTGKNLNLDAARQYALNGDIVSLQDELLTQAGSLDEFSSMGPIQQKAMADAIGMSVEEMTKMLTNAEKLRKAKIDTNMQDKLAKMNAKELRDMAKGAANDAQRDYILQIAKEKESASIKEKMADIMNKISEKLSPIVEEVVELAQGFFDGAKGVSQFDKIIESIDVASIVESVKKIIPVVIKFVTMLIEKLPSIIQFFTDVVDKFTSISSMINPGIAGFGILALKVGGPGGVAAGFKLAGAGAKGLFNLVKGPLSDGIGKLAGGVTDKLGGAFSKVADNAKSGLGGIMEKMGKSKTPAVPSAGKGGGVMESIGNMFEKMDSKKLLAGAAALLIVAGALYIAAKAMQEFSTGVSWKGVLMGIVTLGALVLAVVALGALMMSGVGAAAILAGAAALLILSAALFVMGKAMQEFSKAANMALPFFKELFVFLGPIIQGFAGILMAIADGIKTVANSLASAIGGFMEIAKTDPSKLFTIAGGIGAIGAALAALGAGSGGGALVSGFGNLVGGFMGGDSPLEMLTQISTKLDPKKLSATVLAIRALADAFQYFAEKTAALKDFDTDKLETIIEKMEEVKDAQSGGLGGAITGAANALTGFLGNAFGSSEKKKTQPPTNQTTQMITTNEATQPVTTGGGGSVAVAASGGGTNMANVEKKLDTLISLFTQAATQPTVIKFGDKTIEEIKNQLNIIKSRNIGVDNTYGRTI